MSYGYDVAELADTKLFTVKWWYQIYLIYYIIV